MARRSWIVGLVLLSALAVGAVANRAALRGPLALDDFAQRAMIEGELAPGRGAFNLYDFVSDDNRAALLERGAIPWWSDPRLVIRFLRPLPSALVWLDHRLFGYGSAGPHVLSFIWWIAAVLAAFAFYRSVIGQRPALVATAILALSPTLAIPIVWLANRDALLTITLGACALGLYARWRRERRRGLALAASAAFGASVLTGEYALCLAGYVVAFEVCRRDEPFLRRLTGTLPAAIPFVLYVIAHAALRYGARGSGFYRDPLSDPGAYLRAVPRAASVLLASGWLGVDESASWLAPPLVSALLISAGALLVAVAIWIARRSAPDAVSGGAAWLACGSVLAVLPLAATEPSRRILGVVAMGASPALGVLLTKAVRGVSAPTLGARLASVATVAAVGYAHIVAAPLEARRLSLQAVEEEIRNLAEFSAVRERDPKPDTVLVVRAAYPPTVLWAPFLLRADAPKHWWSLSQTFEQVAAVRTSPTSLEVGGDQGALLPVGPTDLFRTTPFKPGDVVEIAGLHPTILSVDEQGQPRSVRYELDRDLDTPDVAWVAEGRTGFSEIDPRPPVGVGVRLPP